MASASWYNAVCVAFRHDAYLRVLRASCPAGHTRQRQPVLRASVNAHSTTCSASGGTAISATHAATVVVRTALNAVRRAVCTRAPARPAVDARSPTMKPLDPNTSPGIDIHDMLNTIVRSSAQSVCVVAFGSMECKVCQQAIRTHWVPGGGSLRDLRRRPFCSDLSFQSLEIRGSAMGDSSKRLCASGCTSS
jgi:hypothetical protein